MICSCIHCKVLVNQRHLGRRRRNEKFCWRHKGQIRIRVLSFSELSTEAGHGGGGTPIHSLLRHVTASMTNEWDIRKEGTQGVGGEERWADETAETSRRSWQNHSSVPSSSRLGFLMDYWGSVGESWVFFPGGFRSLVPTSMACQTLDMELCGTHMQLLSSSSSSFRWEVFGLSLWGVNLPACLEMNRICAETHLYDICAVSVLCEWNRCSSAGMLWVTVHTYTPSASGQVYSLAGRTPFVQTEEEENTTTSRKDVNEIWSLRDAKKRMHVVAKYCFTSIWNFFFTLKTWFTLLIVSADHSNYLNVFTSIVGSYLALEK